MNNKILFSNFSGEQYEIHRNEYGFSVWWLKENNHVEQVGRHCKNLHELIALLGEVALFTNDEEMQLADFAIALNTLEKSITHYVKTHSEG